MLIKRIFQKIHHRYLQLRWRIPASGAAILSNTFLKDYASKKLPFPEIVKIHRRGFSCMDWHVLGLTKDSCKNYMSNVQYAGLHPINGTFSSWIDDKLTLKYLCSGTPLDQYMPAYYFLLAQDGSIQCLVDCPDKKISATAEDVADVLMKKGALAFKLMAASIGAGFYKAEYINGRFLLNGEAMDYEQFCQHVRKLRSYLVTEFLSPHPELAKYCPDTTNTLRYLVGRIDGQVERFTTFIRFGTKKSGFVENYGVGGILCMLDEHGHFTEGNIFDWDSYTNQAICEHPDNHQPLIGTIPHWNQIELAVQAFSLHFPQLKYMGLDFVVTADDRIKVLEINSLNSLDSLQFTGSVFTTNAANFFGPLLKK